MKNFDLQELLGWLKGRPSNVDLARKYANEAPPLRSELLNNDQLAAHGRFLASTHRIRPGYTKDQLLKRLADNERVLVEVRDMLTAAVKEDYMITPAGEWLLDNFYLVEDNIHTGKRHLPKKYSESLHILSNTQSAGLPRVYDIALELIAHTDGRVDVSGLQSIIGAYQQESELKIGELWAVPIMLRLALIENLRRISTRVAMDRVNQNLADSWASLMMDTAEHDPKNLILVIADMARSGPPLESSFVAELIRQLIWKGPALALPLTWMEQRLSESGLTSNQLVNSENQKQAADQVSISNNINSLRFMGSIDWREFVEEMSAVEQILRQDASGIYPRMDFATRDRYRHKVEELAKYSNRSERDVAALALQLSADNISNGELQGHVGHYLIGLGAPQTEQVLKPVFPARERIRRHIRSAPLLYYSGGISLLSLAGAGAVLWRFYGSVPAWTLALTVAVTLLAVSHFAASFVNWIITLLFRPVALPRLDYSGGVPGDNRTIVVIPTMLMSIPQVDALVDMLEVRFFANRDTNLLFGLLTDFRDASVESLPEDDAVLAHARERINGLNNKHAEDGFRFFLFHRPRKWNRHDKIWMGYERKRGKLTELNALLRGKGEQYFSVIEGDVAALKDVRYVITLDTDTQLPHDSGWKMVGTMAHPLNRPVYDQEKQRVVSGYGILQPRVSVSLPRKSSSVYSLMHGNEPGIDPYTRLTSDVYQDLFDEGSFIGKGIYDVDAFEVSLQDRLPENRVLSHDLLEGCYARAGLLTDVEVYEEYPAHYSSDVNRRHRWIRGDWQIGRWILPVLPAPKGDLRQNRLSALSRWKIFDNLRRSLEPVAMLVMLLAGWVAMPDGWAWTMYVLAIIVLQSVILFVWNIFRKANELTVWQHIRSSLRAATDNFTRNAFLFICLPYEAYFSLDAVCRTVWRMLVSHRKLLEWRVSGSEQASDSTLLNAYQTMWVNPLLGIVTLAYLAAYVPLALVSAAPVLMLWVLAPAIAWKISRPLKPAIEGLDVKEEVFLRCIARKTWGFFERFVTVDDNWLPPDNYQEKGKVSVAHRTSPTNIGLSLLTNLSAHDFGFITVDELLRRTENTFGTLQRMERYNGHLYNWYDTESLAPLPPRYISTVDSGNMAGHLLVLRQGLLALPEADLGLPRLYDGLLDTARILLRYTPSNQAVRRLARTLEELHIDSADRYAMAARSTIGESMSAFVYGNSIESTTEAQWWHDALIRQWERIIRFYSDMLPWLELQEAPARYAEAFKAIGPASLKEISRLQLPEMPAAQTPAEKQWVAAFEAAISSAAAKARTLLDDVRHCSVLCAEFADIDFEFLYDRSRYLLAIGYNTDDQRRDSSYYDLLASEANLTTFLGIAQGKLPPDSWFALGRSLAYADGEPLLLSWSGSMFEYLMPMLVMPEYGNTLLSQTHTNVVQKQIQYGAQRNVPWGISESGYNAVDAALNYQYKAFGVPGTGLKRGLAEELVVAPYASGLALMVSPLDACRNLMRLSAEGVEGMFGFYEAVDYTRSRLPRGQSKAIVQSYMAHHQGMILLSALYTLYNRPMQRRFESELQFRSAMLLLQERIPKITSYYAYSADSPSAVAASVWNTEVRTIRNPNTPVPEVQLLSNGRYHVMVTNAGGGYSRWRNLSVTRWKEDATCDNWGAFCYIRDLESGTFWSNTYQPTTARPEFYEATYTLGRAEYRRSDANIETYTEIVVSPEDDIEIRRVHITNRSGAARYIDVTTYAEVVLTAMAADAHHQAFSKLFINTEIIRQKSAILCHRRARSKSEHMPWLLHLVNVKDGESAEMSFETDRMRFIGRGNTLADPAVMREPGALSGTDGAVLDPVVAIRHKLKLQPNSSVVLDIVTGVCETRDECMSLIDKYQDNNHKDRVFELAWTHSQVVLRQINASEADAQMYGRLASSIIYTDGTLRAEPAVILKNRRGQSGLWGYSVSGDLPIVLLEVGEHSSMDLVRQLVQAHTYWRLKGLATDLVIWNEDRGGYRQTLQNEILGLISASFGPDLSEYPGGIFVRAAEQMSEEDRILFKTVARVFISDRQGSLADHLERRGKLKTGGRLQPQRPYQHGVREQYRISGLTCFNGYGGFSQDGREYVIVTGAGKRTPLPWVNVLANRNFGTIISESGQCYTWIENAHEERLTPWENDPVTDGGGEAFYIRDEETGHFWSPAPLPAPGGSDYMTKHGFGYSTFIYSEDGVETEMTVFVDTEEAVKFFIIKVKNNAQRRYRLSATAYMELVLGDMRPKTGMHIITEPDAATGALLTANYYHPDFANKCAFLDTDDTARNFTCDRSEFIGRNGSLRDPAAMGLLGLSGRSGAGMDACAAMQTLFSLEPGQEHTVVFRLGAGNGTEDAQRLIRKFKGVFAATDTLARVMMYWSRKLDKVRIETPDIALNTLANGWLLYQTIICRLWARSGYYQSGGAYGFRDQLQDVLAVMLTDPQLAREQILQCASRQFVEGDVQHWWHPPGGRGVRTRCSDDLLWLPFVSASYVVRTGDATILDEEVSFLEGRLLNDHEESYYDLPAVSQQQASLYEHCKRAIDKALQFGVHGLPLIGSGDWNDGMDLVGKDGKGESVWLGFFLYSVLTRFAGIAARRSDDAVADRYTAEARQLQGNIEKNAWDGQWYKRAFFDDGTPLGSATNSECRIDSISQSWAVLSGAGGAAHVRQAIDSADKYLVNRGAGLVQLLDPPFDKTSTDPGYIKGYVPGIRENGGQYTHAAIWLIMAQASLGNTDKAWELMNMINPINHGDTAEKIAVYKAEPYVMAADVYSIAQNCGRAGWTWYTGSAGWTYQLIVEWLAGIRKEGNLLKIRPCLPKGWTVKVTYQYHHATYEIELVSGERDVPMAITVDGSGHDEGVLLVDDGRVHVVKAIPKVTIAR